MKAFAPLGPLAGSLLLALTLSAGAAHAEQRAAAPIVFVTPSEAEDPGLVGGGANSYGYGRARVQPVSAVIDVRRQTHGEPLDLTAHAQTQPQQSEEGAAPAQTTTAPQRVGAPYLANGRWYVPAAEPNYQREGVASWYGPQFHGQRTASGEVFDEMALTAAHPTLSIPSMVEVTNLDNGTTVTLRVNDRGPFVGGCLIDVSRGAAQQLGFERAGQAHVRVRYLGPAPAEPGAQIMVRNVDNPPVPAGVQLVSASADATPGWRGPARTAAYETFPEPQPSLPPPSLQAGDEYSARPVPINGGYIVQIGAYANPANARAVQSALADIGWASLEPRDTSMGRLYRVRLGPWNSREEAEAARREAAERGYNDSILAQR